MKGRETEKHKQRERESTPTGSFPKGVQYPRPDQAEARSPKLSVGA